MAADPLKVSSVRTFLAVPLYPLFFHEIESWLRSLKRECPGVRGIDPSEAHLTLHFLGSIAVKEIDVIDAAARQIASFFSPLALTLGAPGGFPNLEKPNIVWLGIGEQTGQLKPLQTAIQGQARALGFRSEARSFLPHVTLGRIKKGRVDLRGVLGSVPVTSSRDEKIADHFALYRSDGSSEGTRYEILKNYPFSKKA